MLTAPETAELFTAVIGIWAVVQHGIPWAFDRWQVWRGKVYVRDWREGSE